MQHKGHRFRIVLFEPRERRLYYPVGVLYKPGPERFLPAGMQPEDAPAQRRNEGHGHKKRNRQGKNHRNHEVAEHLSEHLELGFVNEHGQEHTERRHGGRGNGHDHLTASMDGRDGRALALFAVPVNVIQNND